jgi:serine O-acetyltransferase
MTKKMSAFRADLDKYYRIPLGSAQPSLGKRIRLWIFNFGLHCVACYRFGQYANRLYSRTKILGFIPKCMHFVLSYFVHMVHHVDIDAATIGPGFNLGHVGTIYVGPAVIGRNFSLGHNVTIGMGHSEAGEGIPTIGDDVWVGIGAIISGAITIGNRVTIANGCILSRSVPNGCLVAGNPGRVVLADYDNSKLLGWKFDDDTTA